MSAEYNIVTGDYRLDGWKIVKDPYTGMTRAEKVVTVTYASGGVTISIPFLRFIKNVKVVDQTKKNSVKRVEVSVTNPPDATPPQIKVVIYESTKADTSTGDLIWDEAPAEDRELYILVEGV